MGGTARRVRLCAVLMRQDDPKKCTAARSVRLGLAAAVRRAPASAGSIVLDPYAERCLLGAERGRVRTVTAVDCSWRLSASALPSVTHPARRKLPPLLAGNPVNYAKVGKLTTAEALAGSLFILGRGAQARELLSKFSWGHTFADLNSELLADYARLDDESAIPALLAEYGLPASADYAQHPSWAL